MLSYYKDKTILITGGTGNLGALIVKALSQVSCKIIVLDKEKDAWAPLPGQLAEMSMQCADIRDGGIWAKVLKEVDIIFHCAAQTSTYVANENLVADLAINVQPLVALIETCQKHNWKPDIIFSGTVTEAGLTTQLPVNEHVKDQPVTVYDINKLTAEKYVQYYSRQMGRRSVILRLANLYGPGGGRTSRSADRGILNMMVRKALKGEALSIYGDGDFLRDYIYMDDVVNAFLMAGAKIDQVNGNYYVLGTGEGHSIKKMVHMVAEEVKNKRGSEVEVGHVPAPENLSPIESRNFVADSLSFKEKTGWYAEVNLREGINRTIDYFLEEK